jgi:hypothetical protein
MPQIVRILHRHKYTHAKHVPKVHMRVERHTHTCAWPNTPENTLAQIHTERSQHFEKLHTYEGIRMYVCMYTYIHTYIHIHKHTHAHTNKEDGTVQTLLMHSYTYLQTHEHRHTRHTCEQTQDGVVRRRTTSELLEQLLLSEEIFRRHCIKADTRTNLLGNT